jgi:uncharacterized protein (TIGR00251 family)
LDPGPSVRSVSSGVALDVEVVAGARSSVFPAGYNPWRGRLAVRVAERATEGRANEALMDLVAAFFEIPRSTVRIASGLADHRKTIVISGAAEADVRAQIARALGEREAGAP